MSSAFDPTTFLDATLTEANVKLPPLPVGDYTAILTELSGDTWTKKDDPTKTGPKFNVTLSLEIPPEVQSEFGYPLTYTMKDNIMINLTPSGSIDMGAGQNGMLRKYREALDMNKPGEPFRAREMVGKALIVKIKHDIWEGEPINRIAGVARLV